MDKTIEGKTGIIASTYLSEPETIGMIRAVENAGGYVTGAVSYFSVNGFRPDYSLVITPLDLKQNSSKDEKKSVFFRGAMSALAAVANQYTKH